jgi:CTP synthase (UTP-ammonia lyase)
MNSSGKGPIQVAVVGDYQPENITHRATDTALQNTARHLGFATTSEWIPTDRVADPNTTLTQFQALWIAPGSPYRSLEGALAAIKYARLSGVPLIGTCGGFQHIVVEYARNVLGFADADHAESNPYASRLFVTPLSCSLVGRSMSVRIAPDSIAGRCYGSPDATENYYCNFGLNQDYERDLEDGGLKISGRDSDGEARIIELPNHPFFVGTLFVPQTRSTESDPHPLMVGFLKAAWVADAFSGSF